MEKNIDYTEIVQKAQLGDQQSLESLAGAVRPRLCTYVYRHTLNDDLTNDIVQESILKMLEVLGELKKADRFWPWLYKITLNKIHLHYRNQRCHMDISDPDDDRHIKDCRDSREVVANMVYQEFKEAVFSAMQQLKPEHRSVINMRCYDQMDYCQIAETFGCSKFAAQKLFYRAKRSLKKQLARRGLGRGSMMVALVLFGKLTAPSQAAAAQVAVSAATLNVGAAATAAAMASSKAAAVSFAAAGILAAGTLAATSGTDSGIVKSGQGQAQLCSQSVSAESRICQKGIEYWYYYPSGKEDIVMMRAQKSETGAGRQYCMFLQNAEGNYCYDRQKNTVSIENFRLYRDDLSVWQLPTDSGRLTDSLKQKNGGNSSFGDISCIKEGMLVVLKPSSSEKDGELVVTHHHNMLGEDYFKYDWPADVEVVDNRDVMHKRGWTFFTVTGQIDGKKAEGCGRLPFVYAAMQQNRPWWRLSIGREVFADSAFIGLARPWSGLHTIDTVRRDAAERLIPFETKLCPGSRRVQVIMTKQTGKVIYTIDIQNDLIEKIEFTGGREGVLKFDYSENVAGMNTKFAPPRDTCIPQKKFSIL